MTATIEDEVRAMLARRAADVPDAPEGEVPPLPEGLRFSVDPPGRRRRTAWLVAAVVVLLLGATGVVALTRGDGTRERTGPADAPTRPVGPVPPIEGLPRGLAAEDLLPVWTDPPGPDRFAEEDGEMSNAPLAFGRYLQERFPPGIASSSRVDDVDGFPGWEAASFTLSTTDGDPNSDEGMAYLWWSGEAWSVMAVLSRIQDLSELTVDRARLAGVVYGDGPDRVAAVGEQPDALRIDRWQDGLTAVGETTGDMSLDVGTVDLGAFDGPVTFVIAPVGSSAFPPSYTELVFDPVDLPEPGPPAPSTPPTIADGGRPLPGTSVVGISVDAPVARAVEAVLPAGEKLVAAEHRTANGGRTDMVSFSSVEDLTGYEVDVFRSFDPGEYESMEVPEIPIPWGRAWGGVSAGRAGVTVQAATGVALRVASLDRDGAPASIDSLLAVAEVLVADPVVAAVAGGADPAG